MRKFIRELFGLFLLFWALLLILSLVTFDANDPSFNLVKSGKYDVQNKAGLFGAYASGFLNDIFGIGSLLWPAIFAALGGAYISAKYTMHWWRWCGFFLLTICLLVAASSAGFSIGDLSGGGMVGNSLYFNAMRYLSPVGSFLLWLFIFLIGVQLVCNFSWTSLCAKLAERLKLDLHKSSTPKTVKDANNRPAQNTVHPLASLLSKFKAIPEKKINLSRISSWGNDFSRFIKNLAPAREVRESQEPQQPAQPIFHTAATNSDNTGDTEVSRNNVIAGNGTIDSPTIAEPVQMTLHEEINDTHEPVSVLEDIRIDSPVVEASGETSIKLFEDEPMEDIPLPATSLLTPPAQALEISHDDLKAKGRILLSCLNDFGVKGDLVRISPGPVVTIYEIRPAPGIIVSKITKLSDNLAMALKATAVRIQAPIPGTDTVGVEIPNDNREIVNFRELVESSAFQNSSGPLKMILGKDIAGNPHMADLSKMPHLLIAGATGAGKSVCLNAILVSLLYHAQPRDMRLLLVDPKRMEMAAYADLPHLVHPVVTEVEDAKNALDWAVHEMLERNRKISMLATRNIAGYNQKLAALKGKLPAEYAGLEPLPYIVIVIDELADLMMTAARDVEISIVRLAQLARAAGIHMILATQRPSVDVVTGLIKANFPCRISFQVTSRVDSRTILDETGAEQLLGRGDMFFKPGGAKLVRLHGPFLSDEEVQSVANYWKSQLAPSYNVDFSHWTPPAPATQSAGGDATSDNLYADARAFVLEQGRASISLLQRHLSIGFNRSAKLIEQFEREGILGPADGSKPRKVIHPGQ